MNKSHLLFIPSNKNHVQLFNEIYQELPKNSAFFLTQEPYKTEGSESELKKLGIKYKKLENYPKKDPSIILEQEKIGVIIVGNDTDVIPQWFIHHSKKLNIPSVLIQDGLMFESLYTQNNLPQNLFRIFKKSKIRLLLLELFLILKGQYKRIRDGESDCSQIQVWGQTSEKYFLSLGIDEKKIVITGPLQKFSSSDTENFSKNEQIILFTLSDLVDTKIMKKNDVIKLIDTVCNVVTGFKKTKLIIKPHPREKHGIYENYVKKYGSQIEISYQEFNELIHYSNLLITNLSTTAIEALAFKKPTIIFLPNIEKIVGPNEFPLDLIKENVFSYAQDEKSLTHELTSIMNENFSIDDFKTQKALRNYLGDFNTNNVKKSVQLILELLDNPKNS